MGISVCRNAKLANVFYRVEPVEAYGTCIQKIMDIYEGRGKKPQIETSDNAFTIILPNRNTQTAKKQLSNERDSQEEKVIQLTRRQGMVTRHEVEKLLGIGQTISGRLLPAFPMKV